MSKPKFYTDTHINSEAVKQLRLRGIDILRCEDVQLEQADDLTHLQYATEQNRVMVTCDRDFEEWHYKWVIQGKPHAGIILLKQAKHCKYIGEIVRIIQFWHDITEDENDLANKLWDGEDAQ